MITSSGQDFEQRSEPAGSIGYSIGNTYIPARFFVRIAFAKSVARRVLYLLLASFGGGPNANSRKWVRELEPTEGVKELVSSGPYA